MNLIFARDSTYNYRYIMWKWMNIDVRSTSNINVFQRHYAWFLRCPNDNRVVRGWIPSITRLNYSGIRVLLASIIQRTSSNLKRIVMLTEWNSHREAAASPPWRRALHPHVDHGRFSWSARWRPCRRRCSRRSPSSRRRLTPGYTTTPARNHRISAAYANTKSRTRALYASISVFGFKRNRIFPQPTHANTCCLWLSLDCLRRRWLAIRECRLRPNAYSASMCQTSKYIIFLVSLATYSQEKL